MKATNSTDFEKMYKGSYYTITGAANVDEYINGYNEILAKEEIGTPKEWIMFKGKDMNKYYNLQGNCKYKNNLTFLAFPLDGLNVGKLAMIKLAMEDRWFDDIVDNNARNMEEELV